MSFNLNVMKLLNSFNLVLPFLSFVCSFCFLFLLPFLLSLDYLNIFSVPFWCIFFFICFFKAAVWIIIYIPTFCSVLRFHVLPLQVKLYSSMHTVPYSLPRFWLWLSYILILHRMKSPQTCLSFTFN